MKRRFKGEKILCRITARLLPPDDSYPDAICELVMTESMFYAIDNLGSDLIYHFEIPIHKIASIEEHPPGSHRRSKGLSDNTVFKIMVSMFSFFGGIVMIFTPRKKEKSYERLKIDYENAAGKLCSVSFRESDKIMRMVNTFEKHKNK